MNDLQKVESNAYSLFIYAVRSQITRDYYLRRLRIFFDYIDLLNEKSIEERCNVFALKGKENNNWVINTIERIIQGKSGLKDKNGRDVFAQRVPEKYFSWLRDNKYTPFYILNGIYKHIFNINDINKLKKLHIINIKNTTGEIGLKVGNSEIFGIINIGNKSEFLKLIKEENDIVSEEDLMHSSIFNQIDQDKSFINILIGAKKFIEGWNSWRVSSLGLLNVGKKEGPQIIQLFGRGVRLKGKNMSLRRSKFLVPPHPQYIEILETLNVFGIKASYMDIFRSAIEKEEIPSNEIIIPTKIISPFPNNLYLLRLTKKSTEFRSEIILKLKIIENFKVKLDITPRVNIIDSRNESYLYKQHGLDYKVIHIPHEYVDLVDWDNIFYSIIRFKKDKGWTNLLVTKEILYNIVISNCYELICDISQIQLDRFSSLQRLEEIIILILKKYTESYYLIEQKKWEKENMMLYQLKNDDFIINKKYNVRVKESDQHLTDEIMSMMDTHEIYKFEESNSLKNVYYNLHLFNPLLVLKNSQILMTPISLNKGEFEFIEDLKNYWIDKNLQYKLFFLRNFARGQGIGFFQSGTFYPDFILWLEIDTKQIISFIDPKGLMFVEQDDPKLSLYTFLKDLNIKLNNPKIHLNSFTISATPFDIYKSKQYFSKTSIDELAKRHILFPYLKKDIKNSNYISTMFNILHTESL